MGIFTSIGGLFSPRIKKYQRSIKNLEKQRAANMVANADRAIAFREKEDPREQAHLKQSMWARGLGKSSISDQDTERLSMIQAQRNARIKEAQTYAYAYKKMIRRKHDYEKVNKYMQILDSIVSIAAGAGGGPSGDANYSGGGSGGGWDSGGAGDYNYGGGGSNYA
jgi:uncharacterized membrane protein YgcG